MKIKKIPITAEFVFECLSKGSNVSFAYKKIPTDAKPVCLAMSMDGNYQFSLIIKSDDFEETNTDVDRLGYNSIPELNILDE